MKKILSTFLLRTLALACGLFVAVTDVSSAVYYETIEANKDFYIYNVSAGKYIKNNNGQMTMTALTDASTWQFSGTSGSITVKNGSYYIKAEGAAGSSYGTKYPGSSATGNVTLETSSNKMTIGGNADGYTFSVSKYYLLSGNYNYTYYFAYNGSKFLTNQSSTSNQSKWQLVSKRQFDNTITLSASSLALEAIQGGDPATTQFYVKYDGNPTSISLTDGTDTLIISSPVENQHTILVSYQVDDFGAQTFTLTDGNNATNKATFSFAAGSSATLGLTLSTTAASGKAIDKDKKTMTITGTVVTLKPQYIDWTQDFSALSLTTAPIPLTAVAKTTNGVATSKTITYTLSSTGVVKIVNNVLYVLAEGATTITAAVAKDATYVGAEKSLTINVSGVPALSKTITSSNASSTGIYTGTVGGPSFDYAFHRAKREVDLQRCFDDGGQALFDSLYIFGMTMNTDGVLVSYTGTNGVAYTNVPKINTPSESVGCNATTPCYVYEKSGNTYVYTRTFDATRRRYDWPSTGDKSPNGKHLYFTGYCPFAYMGVTPTEEGWMYFKGGNTNVDIYLDSCQIMGRYKTQTGKNAGYEQYILKLYASVSTLGGETPNISFMSGASAPFVFTSTTKNEGQSYKPHIHIAGDNHLKGHVSSYITQTLGIVDMSLLGTLEMDAGISKVTTYSSPIVVKPTELGQYTDLELTDVWKDNTITNGYLKLNSAAASGSGTSAEKVVSVDLGSVYGSLTINGGQYHVRNSAADGTYTCNLAVGYRLFSKVVEKAGQKVLLHLYGFGGDRADSKVIINSGTFTMYKNMYGTLGQDAYKDDVNFLDLRLPNGNGTSLINGGTFNGISNVVFCDRVISKGRSPRNAQDYWLCLQDVEITDANADGSAQFTIPSPFSDAYVTATLSYSLVSDKDAISAASLYGAQSANAYEKEGTSVVTLLLPGNACEEGGCTNCKYQQDTLIFQWATAFPKFDAEKEISGEVQSVNVGGNITVEVSPEGEELVHATNQLLYLDLEGMEDYSFTLPENGTGLSINDDSKSKPRGRIDNEDDYIVERNINFLKVVQADTWYTFTAPFNIHQISVLETKSEKNIAKMERADAIEKQAQENFEMLYEINDFIIPNEEGRATSITFEGVAESNGKAKIHSLVHYNGSNIKQANYYLYGLKSQEFKANEKDGLLQIEWEPVTAQSGQILMEYGKTYAIQFPYCPMCNDLDSRTYYDYWSNKYILFYGKGPQTLDGTKKHHAIVNKQAGSGYATFSGNTTFSDATISAKGGYIHNQSTNFYELRNSSYALRPGEGFLVYNPNSEKMPARISRTGQIEYDENIETGTNGIPTVGDRTSLMLLGAYDGFEVLSLCEQLVTVYNLQGNIIFQQYMAEGQQVYVATGAGVFIVRGESETIKVMVE